MYKAALLALVVLPLSLLAGEDSPQDVGSRKQLFIDERFIAQSDRVTPQTNPGQKLGQILDGDGQPLMGHVSRVIEDQGKIRMYIGHDGVAIYESDDGLRFTATGRSIGGGTFSTIFLDPHDPKPEQRYKLFLLKHQSPFNPATDGVYAFVSGDGLNSPDPSYTLRSGGKPSLFSRTMMRSTSGYSAGRPGSDFDGRMLANKS